MTSGPGHRWTKYIHTIPLLFEWRDWQLLRKWPLSEVWRVTLRTGKTVIAKWGGGSMARELDVYQRLLTPLQIDHPTLFYSHRDETGNYMLMEDFGDVTVEADPRREYFIDAAKWLFEFRRAAAKNIAEMALPSHVYQTYYKTPTQFLDDIRFVLEHALLSSEHQMTLRDAIEILPTHLNRLYEEFPVTLTHNDYNPKNLIVVGRTIRPIDWSNAYLSPHIGDLYCLLREGEQAGVETAVIIDAYQSVARERDVDWQISLGGLCWLIHGLRWVTEEGIHTVPGTESWVAPMIDEIQNCLGDIDGGR